MKILRAAAMLVLLTGPAVAQQMPNINLIPDTPSKTDEEKQQDKIRDQEYRESLKKIPDAKAPSDPWGDVHSDAPKAATPAKSAKNAKAKTKTGSNTPN
jgi:hypothetical protein